MFKICGKTRNLFNSFACGEGIMSHNFWKLEFGYFRNQETNKRVSKCTRVLIACDLFEVVLKRFRFESFALLKDVE